MASPERTRSTLTKEVLPPQKPQNGLGVMVVAAAAMFFAVASSALILRSRMASECCPTRAARAPAVVVDVALPQVRPTDHRCGEPVYQQLADGTISVTYEACTTGAEQPAAVEAVPASPRGIAVGHIEPPPSPAQ